MTKADFLAAITKLYETAVAKIQQSPELGQPHAVAQPQSTTNFQMKGEERLKYEGFQFFCFFMHCCFYGRNFIIFGHFQIFPWHCTGIFHTSCQ